MVAVKEHTKYAPLLREAGTALHRGNVRFYLCDREAAREWARWSSTREAEVALTRGRFSAVRENLYRTGWWWR